jgi:uncharacterized cupin superfamily protein
MIACLLFVMLLSSTVFAFRPKISGPSLHKCALSARKGPRELHKQFSVEKATPEVLDELDVLNWPTWGTQGSAKYKTGVKSPLKVYDTNELSYITSGSMEITPADAKTGAETGPPVLVSPGDFVTFPDGFACYWFVKQAVTKHWFLY